ncbi:hypothetical protein BP00DRAFT_323545, partial [Aspergillus indologenus CBS 114.80]
ENVRDRILRQIRGVLFDFLGTIGSGTMRILGDTPNSILDPEDYLISIHPFATQVQDCLHEYNAHNETCFVAVNIYPGKHSYFVVDVNNTNYDYQTAHECKTSIPV